MINEKCTNGIEQSKKYLQMPREKYELVLSAGWEEFSEYSYAEASTDRITCKSGISKGLLFHYFVSKAKFYLHCFEEAMRCLVLENTVEKDSSQIDFYTILFTNMHQKIRLCKKYPLQTKMVNMASKEMNAEIAEGKNAILEKYRIVVKEQSGKIMQRAIKTIKLREVYNPLVVEGLQLYTTALINRYLLIYQDNPEIFFSKEKQIQEEMKQYIDLMLDGIRE